ncbi:MAG: CinA family protein [Pseudomonadota bacterium]
MTDALVKRLAKDVIDRAPKKSFTLSVAESCTGGLICAALTDIPGASAVFTHGFITYANEAKRDILGVPQEMLTTHGAVSAPVALAMAKGAKQRSQTDLSVSVTGIAGPGGGSPDKPVGLVYIAVAGPKGGTVHRHIFPKGGREYIRLLTVRAALRHLLKMM